LAAAGLFTSPPPFVIDGVFERGGVLDWLDVFEVDVLETPEGVLAAAVGVFATPPLAVCAGVLAGAAALAGGAGVLATTTLAGGGADFLTNDFGAASTAAGVGVFGATGVLGAAFAWGVLAAGDLAAGFTARGVMASLIDRCLSK
jgi:hypothetical protein